MACIWEYPGLSWMFRQVLREYKYIKIQEVISLKFEKTEVFNIEGAIRGMRNPLASWGKSDSQKAYWNGIWNTQDDSIRDYISDFGVNYDIGDDDMHLAQRLIKGGAEHRKFLRQIFVSVDITAPLYWWKEFDTYKVSVTANSTSTMHKLASTPITLDCFETDDYDPNLSCAEDPEREMDDLNNISTFTEDLIMVLENLRQKYLATKDMRYWKELVRWLPESWLQTRTVTMDYENLRSMYFQRKGHKLTEWRDAFIQWVESLPYAKELICYDPRKEKMNV